jgi:hypothetical protein
MWRTQLQLLVVGLSPVVARADEPAKSRPPAYPGSAMLDELNKQFDLDHDGQLNSAERRAARSALARVRLAPPKTDPDAELPAPTEALADEPR